MTVAPPLTYSTLPSARRLRGALVRHLLWLASMLCWTFLGAALVGGTAAAVNDQQGVLVGGMTPIVLTLLLIAGAILASGVRRARDLALLSYLEQAARLNVPLTRMLAAAEQSERGGVGARLRKLRQSLENGELTSAALARAGRALPRRIIALVSAGERTGRLAAALRRVTVRREYFPARNPTHAIFYRWYPMITGVMCVVVAQILLIYVMPKYRALLRDFHMPLPKTLLYLEPLNDIPGAVLILSIMAGSAIFYGRMLSLIFKPNGVTLGPFRPPLDILLWRLPVAGAMHRSRGMADACYVIADALDSGFARADAIREASAAATSIVLRRKLRRWNAELARGKDLAAAARAARLPKAMGGMLAAIDSDAELRDVLRFLCQYYDNRFSRAGILLRGAMLPAMAIGFGFVVLGLALGVFQPLVDMMYKLMRR